MGFLDIFPRLFVLTRFQGIQGRASDCPSDRQEFDLFLCKRAVPRPARDIHSAFVHTRSERNPRHWLLMSSSTRSQINALFCFADKLVDALQQLFLRLGPDQLVDIAAIMLERDSGSP